MACELNQNPITGLNMIWFWFELVFFFFWLYYSHTGKIRSNKESKAESEGSIQHEQYLHALMHITCFGNTTCFCVLNPPHLVVQVLICSNFYLPWVNKMQHPNQKCTLLKPLIALGNVQ